MVTGTYPGLKLPRVPGHEVVGSIEALGGGVGHVGSEALCRANKKSCACVVVSCQRMNDPGGDEIMKVKSQNRNARWRRISRRRWQHRPMLVLNMSIFNLPTDGSCIIKNLLP
jgi:NADPH:quinone reductase-like Zn-dependent oxidoreductase